MEVEIKVRVREPNELRKLLKEKKFVLVGTATNIDKYFTVIHRDFMKTKECLRIREIPENKKTILTYKPKSTKDMIDEKITWKEEFEIEVADSIIMEKIFKALDVEKLVEVEKRRENYRKDDVNITIDDIKNAGCFMEIEKICDNVKETKEVLWELLEELGFGENDVEVRNYRDIAMEIKNGH